MQRQSRLTVLFSEFRRRQHLQRPCRRHRMTSQSAVLIRKRIDQCDFLLGDNLAIYELAPHFETVGRNQTIMKDTARTEVERGNFHRETFWTKPLQQLVAIGPRLPYFIERRVNGTRYDEIF